MADLPLSPPAPILPAWGPALVWMGGLAVLATAAPLLTYSTALALFGTAHVLAELRFVEARFSARLAPRLLWGMGLLLAGVVLVRFLKALDRIATLPAIEVELMLVAGLGALTLPILAALPRRGPLLVGLAVVVLVSVGLLWEPLWTLLFFTALHNWTPLGFFAEGLPPQERPHGWALGTLAFLLLPALIASGLPAVALQGLPGQDWTLLPTGDLAANLGAYLPAAWHHQPWAISLFSAMVFAQCMHYVAVIGLMPRIAPGGPQADAVVGLSRIPPRAWLFAILLLTTISVAGYTQDFRDARVWYGLIAGVHAWLEVPILLLALLSPLPAQRAPYPNAG